MPLKTYRKPLLRPLAISKGISYNIYKVII